MKNEKKPLKVKRITLILIILFIVFLGGNAFAALVGAPNIFFAIKNLVVQEDVNGRDELLSDKEITISYFPIEITDEINLQVNKIVLEENKASLFIKVDNDGEDKELGFRVETDENGDDAITLGQAKYNIETGSNEKVIELTEQKINETDSIVLVVYSEEAVLRTLTIDLANKEITVEGEDEISKVSEVELKKYLGAFSVLNSNNFTLKNEQLLDVVKNFTKSEIIDFEIYDDNTREKVNKLIEEFYYEDFEFDKVDGEEKTILKLEGKYYGYVDITDSYQAQGTGTGLVSGKCLEIEDISYENGIYTVEYIYILPTFEDEYENKLEDLTQYKTTIKLKLNEKFEYSKYKIVSLESGEVIGNDKQTNTNSGVFEGVATKESDCERLLNNYFKCIFDAEQNALNIPVDLGFADKDDISVYKLEELKGESESFYNTEIEYLKFRNEMLKYMTDKCIDANFSEFTRNINNTLYISATGGSDMYYEITEFKLESKDGNTYNYKGKIVTYTLDHINLTEYEKTPKAMNITIEKQDGKFLISEVEIDYTDYTINGNNEVVQPEKEENKEEDTVIENINYYNKINISIEPIQLSNLIRLERIWIEENGNEAKLYLTLENSGNPKQLGVRVQSREDGLDSPSLGVSKLEVGTGRTNQTIDLPEWSKLTEDLIGLDIYDSKSPLNYLIIDIKNKTIVSNEITISTSPISVLDGIELNTLVLLIDGKNSKIDLVFYNKGSEKELGFHFQNDAGLDSATLGVGKHKIATQADRKTILLPDWNNLNGNIIKLKIYDEESNSKTFLIDIKEKMISEESPCR